MRLGYAESGTNAALIVRVPPQFKTVDEALTAFGNGILKLQQTKNKSDIKEHIELSMYDLLAGDADICSHYLDVLFQELGFDFWPSPVHFKTDELITISAYASEIIADVIIHGSLDKVPDGWHRSHITFCG
jgi:hypothetical protein